MGEERPVGKGTFSVGHGSRDGPPSSPSHQWPHEKQPSLHSADILVFHVSAFHLNAGFVCNLMNHSHIGIARAEFRVGRYLDRLRPEWSRASKVPLDRSRSPSPAHRIARSTGGRGTLLFGRPENLRDVAWPPDCQTSSLCHSTIPNGRGLWSILCGSVSPQLRTGEANRPSAGPKPIGRPQDRSQ